MLHLKFVAKIECSRVLYIFTDTPTSELLPDLKDFPDPPLDLSPDSVPIEDHTKPGE